ncbi:MAG: T9SS type A sorting domain-containing protein, partial [Bacteroidia bacterium]|nr:T9SS type A sorting domain-containing protein [Bacteroidia bacterium]
TGATSASITVSPSSTTSYTVTVTSAATCTSSCSRTVNVTTPPTCHITGPTFLCLGGPPISLTASGGNNCSWIGPNNFTSNNCTIGPFSQMSESGTYTVTVSNGNCSSTCAQSIAIVPCSDNHCGFTQGFYGNAGGRDCNQLTTTQILNNLLISPLVIGCGGNTLTLTSTDVSCLLARMPGGGKAVTISGNNSCSSIVGIPLFGNGRFRDILLSQTITLSLNTRYDGSLLGLQLTGTYMTTIAASTCPPDGVPVPNTIAVYVIPQSVLTYLGANNTVQDLLNLANDALCGAYTPGVGDPTLSDISKAEDALNQGFDECRFLIGFSNTLRETNIGDNNHSFITYAYPNPFNSITSILFTTDKANSNAVVEVFNSTGAKVASLFNGPTEEGITYKVNFDGSEFPAGIYVCRISNDDSVFIEKLILIK